MQVNSRTIEMGVAIALLLAGIFVAEQSLQMPLDSMSLPGPGVFPLAMGAALAVTAAALLVGYVVRPEPGEKLRLGHGYVAVALLAIGGMAELIERTGYLISATLFLFVLLASLSKLGWWRAGIAAFAAALVSQLLFQNVLGVALPGWPGL
jgi:putative tricarboxylic transport membrane protein